MDRTEALAHLGGSPSGHLATTRPDGRPHIVVVTFALTDDTLVTAIDQKPKTTQRLQRVVNIEANPIVSFLVDHYDDDWANLWWVRIDGRASIHFDGHLRSNAVEALTAKYPQYVDQPPEGPAIAITLDRISGWSSG